MSETIHTHKTDPEAPDAHHYVVTIMSASGQFAQLVGMDPAAPRDVERRVGDFKRRYLALVNDRATEQSPMPHWHEALLEGDEDGDGRVVIHDPRLVVSVATPSPGPEWGDESEELELLQAVARAAAVVVERHNKGHGVRDAITALEEALTGEAPEEDEEENEAPKKKPLALPRPKE
jgi:hypothetical protein